MKLTRPQEELLGRVVWRAKHGGGCMTAHEKYKPMLRLADLGLIRTEELRWGNVAMFATDAGIAEHERRKAARHA